MEIFASMSPTSALMWAAVLVVLAGALLYVFWTYSQRGKDSIAWGLSVVSFPFAACLMFAGGYVYIVTWALRGVAFFVTRYSDHSWPVLHADSSMGFWLLLGADLVVVVLMALMATGFAMALVATWKEYREEAVSSSSKSAAQHVGEQRRRTGHFMLLVVACGVLVVVTLAGVHMSLQHQDNARVAARDQINTAIAFAARAEAAVDDYHEQYDALPADNRVAGLPQPQAMRTNYVSSLVVEGGTLTLTLDKEAVDEHIRGRHIVLFGPYHGKGTSWRCVSMDIDVAYLPESCLGMPRSIGDS